MKIAIIGAGFVGEATGRGFLKHGHGVDFVDVDENKVDSLRGKRLKAYLAKDYDTITTDVTKFCVPTPTEGHNIQLNYLEGAATDFATRLKKHDRYHVAVIRSTVPPGTTRDIFLPIIERVSGKKVGKNFGLVMQPEYLREVSSVEDFERPWFVLIGEYDKKSGGIIDRLYRSFDAPIEHCSLEEAEIQKYIHNVFNAVKIAFFNEMRLAIRHHGWNEKKIFLATAESCEGIWNPIYGLRDYGPFDGSCLPKDTRSLLEWGEKNGFNFKILRSVIEANLGHEQLLGKNKSVRVNYLNKIRV